MALPDNTSRGTYHWYSSDNITYTRITKCVSINFPDINTGSVEDTTLDTTSWIKEFTPGLMDPGKVTFRARYADALHETLDGYRSGQNVLYWRTQLPLRGSQTVKTKIEYQGFLTRVRITEATADENNKLELECEIQVTGSYTVTKGS